MPAKLKKQRIVYHIAKTKDELDQAFSLVYKEYASRGFIPKHYKSKLRLSLYNALPSTTTFVAKQGERVVASVTLIADSPMGLPMDKIYKKEVDGLRKKGRRVAEAGQLAVDSSLFPKGWFSMFNFTKLIFIFKLFKLVLDYSLYVEKINEICIATHPRLQHLYKFLYFEELAGLKYYGSVNKAPALAKHLSLDAHQPKAKQRKGLYNIFYGKKTDPQAFKNKFVFKPADLKYFFMKKSDIFQKATKEQLDYIKSCYPAEEYQKVFAEKKMMMADVMKRLVSKVPGHGADKVAEIVARSFYREMKRYGFSGHQIIMVATDIIDCLNKSLTEYKVKQNKG